ncbi:chitinase-3-like protein 2 [Ornithodoros turicata]|uniref:chitinase-3-like protein 2 n=1 Tax=Ornithodoros turicata TaxID=34597 RepID=UPI0031389A6D
MDKTKLLQTGRQFYRVSKSLHESNSTSREENVQGKNRRKSLVAEDPEAQKRNQALMRKLVKEHPELEDRMRVLYPDQQQHLKPGARPPAAAAGADSWESTMSANSVLDAERADPRRKTSVGNITNECLGALLIVSLVAGGMVAAALGLYNKFVDNEKDGEESLEREEPYSSAGGDYDKGGGGSGGGGGGGGGDKVRTFINYQINPDSPVYAASRGHTVVCVYQTVGQDLVALGSRYGVPLFPYPYCHLTLYCCVTFGANQTIEARPNVSATYYAFSNLMRRNPVVRTAFVIGGLPDDEEHFQNIVDDPQFLKSFVEHVKRFCKVFSFDGVYLWWTNAPETSKDNITKMVTELGQALAPSSGTVGLVLPHDPKTNAPGFDLSVLNPILGNNTIMVLPPEYKDTDYRVSKTYYHATTLQTLSFLKDFNRGQACVLLPSGALTFSKTSPPGPGTEGPFTRTPGQLSLYETCQRVPGCTVTKRDYANEATCNDVLVNYPSNDTLQRFICELETALLIGCVGFWRSDLDDFTGSCQLDDFPLSKAVIEIQSCANLG